MGLFGYSAKLDMLGNRGGSLSEVIGEIAERYKLDRKRKSAIEREAKNAVAAIKAICIVAVELAQFTVRRSGESAVQQFYAASHARGL